MARITSHKKGRTYEELYGVEKAKEIKNKLSLSNLSNPRKFWSGRHRSDGTKNKISLKMKGRKVGTPFEEHRKKIAIALMGHAVSEDTRNKISSANKGRPNPHPGHMVSENTRRKISQFMTGRKPSVDTIEKIRLANTGKKMSENAKNKLRIAHLGKELSQLTKEKMRATHKKLWEDPVFRNDMVRAIAKAICNRPNKAEKFITELLDEYFPNEFKYNISPNITIINGRIPDWVNCNGQKKVILFNGIYWHLWRLQQKSNSSLTKEQVEELERKPYEAFGFQVLHIWEDESIDQIVSKIHHFVRGTQ